MEFTSEQRRAIESRGTNLLLSAAAGSGKTTVLVERILGLILRDGVDVDRLLVVTFTRAAAADMRAKLTRRLTEAAAAGDPRLSRQLRALERASISTLHAFCSEFLRTDFEAAGVDPAFRVLDDAEDQRLFSEALDEALEAAYARGGDDLLSLDYGRGAEGVRSAAEALCRFLRERPEPEAWLSKATASDRAAVGRWIDELSDAARRRIKQSILLHQEIALMPECPDAYAAAIGQDVAGLEALLQQSTLDGLLRGLEAFRPARASGRQGAGNAESAALIRKLRESAQKPYKSANPLGETPLSQAVEDAGDMCGQLRTLGELCREAEEIYASRKGELGALSYADLEHRTLRALKGGAADSLRARFDYVFVDEYQDTSDVQEAIVRQIVRADNLFMVGDVKQSIYRFRQAEPGLFLEKYAAYGQGEGGALMALTGNFRSSLPIVNTVNRVFARLMRGGDSEILYDELARLNPGGEHPRGEPPVEVHIVDRGRKAEGEEADRSLKGAQREALLIARRIRALMAEDPTLRYRDIAILTRAGSGAFTPMLPMLLREGIPAYADGAEGYFNTMEIALALALMKLVVNERSDVELIGVLRSGIVGLDEEALAQIRVASPRTPFLDAARAAAQGQGQRAGQIRGLFELLSALRLRSGALGLGQLLREALNQSGLYLYAGALPGGEQRQANLDLLVSNADAFDRDVSGSLARFLQHTQSLSQRGDGGTAHMLGESDDVVRLMTIHKSKGLEFRVVFGALLGKRFAGQNDDVVLAHRTLGAGMDIYDPTLRTRRKTLPKLAILARRERESMAEEMRVLYVLLTRARERLILTGTCDMDASARFWKILGEDCGAARCYLDLIMGPLSGDATAGAAEDISITAWRESDFATPQELSEPERALADFQEALTHPELYLDADMARRLVWRYPDPEGAKRPLKLSVSGLIREMEGPDVIAPMAEAPAFLAESGAITGASRGSAYHRALQCLSLPPLAAAGEALNGAIAAQLDALTAARRLTQAERRSIDEAMLARFMAGSLGRRLLRAETVRREWAFNVLMRAQEVAESGETAAADGQLIVQGVIDCCFLEDGQWVLLDYKTDRTDDAAQLMRRYRRQIDIYALALERITGIPVKARYLCLLSAGAELSIS